MPKKKDNKMFNRLKDKASKMKDTSIEKAKELSKSRVSGKAMGGIQNTADKAFKKIGLETSNIKNTVASNTQGSTETAEDIQDAAMGSSQKAESKAIVREKTVDQAGVKMILEELLGATLPDWAALKTKASETIDIKEPAGCVKWMESSLTIDKRHLKKGIKHDLWQDENILVLKAQPTIFENVLDMIASLFSVILIPWYSLNDRIESLVRAMAEKLGSFFSIFALPIALIAFLGDIVTMGLEFLFSIPRLILSPFTLVRSFFALILQFFAKLIARLIWAFLLPVIGRILSGLKPGKTESLQKLLTRRPWVRYLILGFFRSERPMKSFVIIPAQTVSQVLVTQRGGMLNSGEYLIVVEGEKLVSGFMKRFWSWFKMLMLPFYWERTVHFLCLPKDAGAKKSILDVVSSTLRRQVESW